MKSVTQAVLEQRCIIKFLFKEGNKHPNIIQPRANVYVDRTMKETQVYFWIAEVRRGREDLSEDERPERSLDIDLDEMRADRLEADSNRSGAQDRRLSEDFLANSDQSSAGRPGG
jgi:hypothetical protein